MLFGHYGFAAASLKIVTAAAEEVRFLHMLEANRQKDNPKTFHHPPE